MATKSRFSKSGFKTVRSQSKTRTDKSRFKPIRKTTDRVDDKKERPEDYGKKGYEVKSINRQKRAGGYVDYLRGMTGRNKSVPLTPEQWKKSGKP